MAGGKLKLKILLQEMLRTLKTDNNKMYPYLENTTPTSTTKPQ
jgi:hypothetical protein